MINKFLGTVGMSVLLTASLVAPVLAADNATSAAMMTKKEVATCMKTATTKKNATNKTAKQAYSAAVARARADYNAALKAAKETFNADNKMCKVAKAKTMTIDIKAQNDSGINGKAVLTEENGKVKVAMMLTGSPAGVSEPAHIHTGTCATLDGVKYPLTSVVDGKSETTVDVTFAQLAAGMPLAINVHKSGAEVGVYVACGDLKF